jgi:epoxyqueuosine reductase
MPLSSVATLNSRICEEARRLGFAKIGFASVRPLPFSVHFKEWLENGMHGEMRYLENHCLKRQDPSLLLAGARSMLVLAINYSAGRALADRPLKGKISRYALSEDYHQVVMDRLRNLLQWIQNEAPATRGLCYVDTGPVMEKIWGAQTSLGWMGKHTNLIARGIGSWFFIGVILLDIDLECDRKEKDFCGSCRRCIDACPTGAIVAPYVLDARLCIAYLTIELRGPIPKELRPLIGNRIFGCDDCQEACPWNKFAVAAPLEEFSPREDNIMPDLMPLVRITSREFKERFKNSAIKRATRDVFVRNVVVALGNSHQDEAVPALGEAVRDESSLVRSHAVWALGQIGTESARKTLDWAREKESDRAVLEEIALAIAKNR